MKQTFLAFSEYLNFTYLVISKLWGRLRQVLVAIQEYNNLNSPAKVNSVQEACAKCCVVHLSKFETLQTT